jgi:hypothetical protein
MALTQGRPYLRNNDVYLCFIIFCQSLNVKDSTLVRLPPSEDTFKQHVLRSSYQTKIWLNAHIPKPAVGSPLEQHRFDFPFGSYSLDISFRLRSTESSMSEHSIRDKSLSWLGVSFRAYVSKMKNTSELWFQTGLITSTKDCRRYIPVHELCKSLSSVVCEILPAAHALTGMKI